MSNTPREFVIPAYDAKRISRNTLHKYLIREKPDEKILQELAKNEACIYEQTIYGQSSFFLAIAKQKTEVIKKLVEIYEKDFEVLKTNGYTNDTAVLIAFGANDVKFFEGKLAKLSADQSSDEKVLILIKETNESVARVASIAPKSEEDRKIFLQIVEKLHRNGTFDASTRNSNGETLFHVAASLGLIPILEKLLEWGARHDELNNQSSTPLMLACTQNRLETVKWFHKKFNFDITKFLMEGEALFNIVTSGSLEVFEFFINEVKRIESDEQIEAIFNRKTEYQGYNVMMLAIRNSQSEFAKKCLKFEPNLVELDNSNNNILHAALNAYPIDRELCKILIQSKPNLVVMENSNQETPLHLLARNNFLDEMKDIYERFPFYKNTFFKHFADTPTMEKRLEHIWCATPGHDAAKAVMCNCHVEMTEFILENHPENFENSSYISDLVVSVGVYKESNKIIELLKKLKHFDMNVPSLNGDYPLLCVLSWNRFEIYNNLLETCKIKDWNSMIDHYKKCNLLHYAIYSNPVEVSPIAYCRHGDCSVGVPRDVDSSDDETVTAITVVDPGFSMPILENAAAPEPEPDREAEKLIMWKIFTNLIKSGVDIKNKDNRGNSLLHTAVVNDNLEVVQELLKLGLPIDEVNEEKEIPLHCVRSIEIFDALTTNGELKPEMINKKDNNGMTPFARFVTLFCRDEVPLELFNAFIKHGADGNAADNSGVCPIHIASTEDWIKLLIENGADARAVNTNGENAVHLALRDQKLKQAKFFLLNTDIDRFALTNDGISYLGYFTSGNVKFDKVFNGELKPVLDELLDKFINGKGA